MSLTLGLDVSTSNVGWCVVDSNNLLIAAGAVELSKKKDIFEKTTTVREEFSRISDLYPLTSVVIEENLQAFRPGFSSAKTIVTLARFNGIVTLLAFEETGIKPEFVNVNSARKSAGLKVVKKSEVSTKDQVLNFVKERVPEFEWPTRTLKSGVRKGLVIPADCCYDIADAYIVAVAGSA